MRAALLMALALFVSCANTPNTTDSKQETAEALQDNSYEELVSERGYSDIAFIDRIYNKVAEKDAGLKNFGAALKQLNKSKEDSLQPFDRYNEKSALYYESAKNYIAQIQDSVLKQQMTAIIASSIAQYKTRIALHNNLHRTAREKELMLNDLHTAIKIKTTLPVIEGFQKQNLTAAGPIEGYTKRLDEMLVRADTLSKY